MTIEDERAKYQTAEPRPPELLPSEAIISPDTRRGNRLPPGQTRTRKWPVLHYGRVPQIAADAWQLEIAGLVERPQQLDWAVFRALPRRKVYADFHCVTRWSRLDNVWEGVATRDVLALAGVLPAARYVVLHGYDDGFTTNLPLDEFLAEDALLADTHDGLPLSADHGAPVRAIVPQLYAWKSAKWLKRIELVEHDQPGFWERGGYHNHGNPWTEERFG